MLSHILLPIREDLEQVHKLISGELTIRAGYVGSFAHLEFSNINKQIRPALALMSARLFDANPEKAAALAGVFQFIYMASTIHQGISEQDSDFIRSDSDPRDGSQFPVLVGDYLYGKFFTFLCDAEIIELLSPLAQIICEIHEGGILKKKISGQNTANQVFLEVVRKETAELFAGCCGLSARLAGASIDDQEAMRCFGLNLGMAYGLLEQGALSDQVQAYLEAALSGLSRVPQKPERGMMEDLACNLSGLGLPACHRMVI